MYSLCTCMWHWSWANRAVPPQTSNGTEDICCPKNICTCYRKFIDVCICTYNFYVRLCDFKYIFSKNSLIASRQPISHTHLTIDLHFPFQHLTQKFKQNTEQVLTNLEQQFLEGKKIHLLRDILSKKSKHHVQGLHMRTTWRAPLEILQI